MPRFYKLLDHISDAYIEVDGSSLEECFNKAGLAVVDLMISLHSIAGISDQIYRVKGFDLQSLLYNFLEQILVKVTSGQFLPNSLNVKIRKVGGEYELTAKSSGEPFSTNKHKPKLEIKAITYHLMEIRQTKGKFVIRFLLDL